MCLEYSDADLVNGMTLMRPRIPKCGPKIENYCFTVPDSWQLQDCRGVSKNRGRQSAGESDCAKCLGIEPPPIMAPRYSIRGPFHPW